MGKETKDLLKQILAAQVQILNHLKSGNTTPTTPAPKAKSAKKPVAKLTTRKR